MKRFLCACLLLVSSFALAEPEGCWNINAPAYSDEDYNQCIRLCEANACPEYLTACKASCDKELEDNPCPWYYPQCW